MATPYSKGLLTGSIITVVDHNEELWNIVHRTHIIFHDFYETHFKKFGIEREEMMILMPDLMRVDSLSGDHNLSYIDNKSNK